PAGATNIRMQYTADNLAEVYLNGKEVARSTEWTALHKIDLSSHARPGKENAIAVRVTNTGSSANSAGLILTILADIDGKPAFTLITDQTWQSSRAPEDSAWPESLLKESTETAKWEGV